MTQRDAHEVVDGCGIGAHCGGSVQSQYLGRIRVGANRHFHSA